MEPVEQLVLALERAEVLPRLDSEGTIYALAGLRELESQGWKFVPPEEVRHGD